MRPEFQIKMISTIALAIFSFLPSLSYALPAYMAPGNALNVNTIIQSVYGAGSGAGTMACTLCHPSGSIINANTFGEHFRMASVLVTGSPQITDPIGGPAMMRLVFQSPTFINTDSDGDTFRNELEFDANTVANNNLSFPGSNATTTTTTTTTTRIQFPTAGATPANITPDASGNALSGGCSGGGRQSYIERHDHLEKASVWLGLCVLPLLGLIFRRRE